VTEVGKKVLEKIAAKFGHDFTYDEALIGQWLSKRREIHYQRRH